MNNHEAQRTMLRAIERWLERSVDVDQFVSDYWGTRRFVMSIQMEAFDAPFGVFTDPIDGAVHVYGDELGETELRVEVQRLYDKVLEAMPELRPVIGERPDLPPRVVDQ